MNAIEDMRIGGSPPGLDEGAILLRRAAEAGPGYRGRRCRISLEDQAALAREIHQSGGNPPSYLGTHATWVDRRAKLFEAGDYPDKGVKVTREDLLRLAESFDLPVPVLIEHAMTPLEIGFLTEVDAVGDELFGTLSLSEEADALIERSGAKQLSLGLSADLAEIREVSLVRNPRVESARMFGSDLQFWAELDATPWRARFEALEAKSRQDEARRQVSEWIKAGKLLPSQVAFAEAILLFDGSVRFDGESKPLAAIFRDFVGRQPSHGLFAELAPGGGGSSEALFLPEEAEFYRKHFPDVGLDVIAARRKG